MAGSALVVYVDDAVQTPGLGLELAVVRNGPDVVAQDENGIGTKTLFGRRDLHDEEPHRVAVWPAPVLRDRQVAARVPDQKLDMDVRGHSTKVMVGEDDSDERLPVQADASTKAKATSMA